MFVLLFNTMFTPNILYLHAFSTMRFLQNIFFSRLFWTLISVTLIL